MKIYALKAPGTATPKDILLNEGSDESTRKAFLFFRPFGLFGSGGAGGPLNTLG